MPAAALATKRWKQKFGAFPVLTFIFTFLFFYDGFIGYPRSDARFEAHKSLTPEQWNERCQKEGWSTTPPKEYLGPGKYTEQKWWGAGFSIIGIASLVHWLRGMRSSVRSDEEGVTAPNGTRVPYSAITKIDQRKWKEYGLAYIYYTLGGKSGKFTLDYEKHQEKALEEILADILKHTAGKAAVEG